MAFGVALALLATAYAPPAIQLGDNVVVLAAERLSKADSPWIYRANVSCSDDAAVERLPGVMSHEGYVDRNLRDRPESHCFTAATAPCFRAVYDLSLATYDLTVRSLDDPDLMHALAISKREESGAEQARAVVADFARELIEEHAGVQLQLEALRVTPTREADDANGQPMRADLSQDENHWYTALVYFGEAGVDYGSGGATLFVDAAEAAGDELLVGAGLKVEAQKGRMVLFSGGLENVYGRMAMGGWGQHSLMQMWFRCNSTQYGEDERSGKEEL